MASNETQFLASWISRCSVPAWWFVLHKTLRLLPWWVTGLGGQLKFLTALKYLFLKKKKKRDGHGDDGDDDDKENEFSRVTVLKSWTHPAKMTQIMGLFFFFNLFWIIPRKSSIHFSTFLGPLLLLRKLGLSISFLSGSRSFRTLKEAGHFGRLAWGRRSLTGGVGGEGGKNLGAKATDFILLNCKWKSPPAYDTTRKAGYFLP